MINETRQSRLKLAIVLVVALLTFRVVDAVASVAWGLGWRASYFFASYVFRYKFIAVPAMSVTSAVLAARWIETKLDSLGHRMQVVLLIVSAALALCPVKVQLEMEARAVMPTPEMLRRMGYEEPHAVAEPVQEEVQVQSETEVDPTTLELTTNNLRSAQPSAPTNKR